MPTSSMPPSSRLPMSSRKLIGTFILLTFLVLYGLVMFAIGTAMAVNTTSRIAALAFYALAGLGWVIPAGWILQWILKPLREAEEKSRDA